MRQNEFFSLPQTGSCRPPVGVVYRLTFGYFQPKELVRTSRLTRADSFASPDIIGHVGLYPKITSRQAQTTHHNLFAMALAPRQQKLPQIQLKAQTQPRLTAEPRQHFYKCSHPTPQPNITQLGFASSFTHHYTPPLQLPKKIMYASSVTRPIGIVAMKDRGTGRSSVTERSEIEELINGENERREQVVPQTRSCMF